jgi:hypothetical protein
VTAGMSITGKVTEFSESFSLDIFHEDWHFEFTQLFCEDIQIDKEIRGSFMIF